MKTYEYLIFRSRFQGGVAPVTIVRAASRQEAEAIAIEQLQPTAEETLYAEPRSKCRPEDLRLVMASRRPRDPFAKIFS
jgi:hypothetical protein